MFYEKQTENGNFAEILQDIFDSPDQLFLLLYPQIIIILMQIFIKMDEIC